MPDGDIRIERVARLPGRGTSRMALHLWSVTAGRQPSLRSLGASVAFSSVALALVQPPHAGGAFAGVALCPWVFALRRRGALAGGASGLAFGMLTGLVGIPWMPDGLERVGLGSPTAILATALLAVWASGVPWAGFGLVAAAGRRLSPPFWCALLAGLAFAIDALRSAFALAFPWALVGHTQAGVPGVAQLALLGGVPLVSALVVALGAAAACAIASRGEARPQRAAAGQALAAALGAYAALALLGLPLAVALRGTIATPPAPALSLLVVQPNLHPSERWQPRVQRTNLAILAAQSARALEEHPADLVVWPENTLTTPLEADPLLAAALRERVDALGVPVVLGAVREGEAPGRLRTSALWVAPGQGIVDALDKTRAIPLVETAATAAPLRALETLLGLGSERRLVAEGRDERPLRGAFELVPALCYEILFPGLVAGRRTEASAAIVNLGNDSWFLSSAPSGHQIAIASFRALEQRLFLVRAVHGGASAVLDPFGRAVEALPFGQRGALAARIAPQAPPHPIERAGIAALAGAGAGLGLGVSSTWFGRKPS